MSKYARAYLPDQHLLEVRYVRTDDDADPSTILEYRFLTAGTEVAKIECGSLCVRFSGGLTEWEHGRLRVKSKDANILFWLSGKQWSWIPEITLDQIETRACGFAGEYETGE